MSSSNLIKIRVNVQIEHILQKLNQFFNLSESDKNKNSLLIRKSLGSINYFLDSLENNIKINLKPKIAWYNFLPNFVLSNRKPSIQITYNSIMDEVNSRLTLVSQLKRVNGNNLIFTGNNRDIILRVMSKENVSSTQALIISLMFEVILQEYSQEYNQRYNFTAIYPDGRIKDIFLDLES